MEVIGSSNQDSSQVIADPETGIQDHWLGCYVPHMRRVEGDQDSARIRICHKASTARSGEDLYVMKAKAFNFYHVLMAHDLHD